MRPLGPGAPRWARRLYRRSIRVLLAFTDPHSGAMIAGERDGWDYVWPRDAGAGALALEAAGLRPEAQRVDGFLGRLDLDAARFYPDGDRVPGRPAAGDEEGWSGQDGTEVWRDRQDYGENVTGDLLGNAIAAGAPTSEIERRFLSPRGLVREQGGTQLDSAAAWAVTVFPRPELFPAARRTLSDDGPRLDAVRHPADRGLDSGRSLDRSDRVGSMGPRELGDTQAADRLLAELHRAETPDGTLPERVDAPDGRPDLDHAARLVPRLRDPRSAGAVSRLCLSGRP